jgi:programmed cell death 6-interacting protein
MLGQLAHQDELEQAYRARKTAAGENEDESDLAAAATQSALHAQVDNYSGIITHAAQSDQLVRAKFGDWETRIASVSVEEQGLERAIPRVGASAAAGLSRQTETVRELRRVLDDLTDLEHVRGRLVDDAKAVTTHSSGLDDTLARKAIVREADRLISASRATESQSGRLGVPLADFEDVIGRLLEGTPRSRDNDGLASRLSVDDVEANLAKQSDLLDRVKVSATASTLNRCGVTLKSVIEN